MNCPKCGKELECETIYTTYYYCRNNDCNVNKIALFIEYLVIKEKC